VLSTLSPGTNRSTSPSDVLPSAWISFAANTAIDSVVADRLSGTRAAVTTTSSATAAIRSVKSCDTGTALVRTRNGSSAKPSMRARS
jgi:hypothetical protein